jgi:hypothetical protein
MEGPGGGPTHPGQPQVTSRATGGGGRPARAASSHAADTRTGGSQIEERK